MTVLSSSRSMKIFAIAISLTLCASSAMAARRLLDRDVQAKDRAAAALRRGGDAAARPVEQKAQRKTDTRSKDSTTPRARSVDPIERARLDSWPPSNNRDPDFPMSIRVRPSCGSARSKMVAYLDSIPKTSVALAVVYADGNAGDTWYTGAVGRDGNLIFRFVIPADAARGEGRVMVTGSNGDHGTKVSAPFEVARPGGCS